MHLNAWRFPFTLKHKQTYLKYCGGAINNRSKGLFEYLKNSIASSITHWPTAVSVLTRIIINSRPSLNRYTTFRLLKRKLRKQKKTNSVDKEGSKQSNNNQIDLALRKQWDLVYTEFYLRFWSVWQFWWSCWWRGRWRWWVLHDSRAEWERIKREKEA